MNPGPSFVRVARLSDIADGRSARVKLDGDEIALWHVRGRVYAIGNVCSHQHFSELHHGILSGLTVACPMHGWTYSLETGVAVTGSGRVRTYNVKVEGDTIYIEQPGPEE
ncbi:MAG TPA: Rieske 2Fe-2S domain-containing protein [Bacteroidota bacterium]|nr:Rieske 2Fe-2S domain-containing protein [Bacteroidota bacterium]